MKMRKLEQDNWTIENLTNTDIMAILIGAESMVGGNWFSSYPSDRDIFESCESLKQQFDSIPTKEKFNG